MDKRQYRSQTKRELILRTALDLFATYGVERVSVDEIAAQANVSKVTIYKYFGSKDALYVEVVNLFIETTLAETEAVFNSNMDFMEKLKVALLSQLHSSQWVNWNYLFEIWDRDGQSGGGRGIQERVTGLMETLINEGKAKGLIDESLSFDLILLYADIFREGLRAKSAEFPTLLTDKTALESLVQLYFWGLMKR
jgi:AcrR family transcriptional regulator